MLLVNTADKQKLFGESCPCGDVVVITRDDSLRSHQSSLSSFAVPGLSI